MNEINIIIFWNRDKYMVEVTHDQHNIFSKGNKITMPRIKVDPRLRQIVCIIYMQYIYRMYNYPNIYVLDHIKSIPSTDTLKTSIVF